MRAGGVGGVADYEEEAVVELFEGTGEVVEYSPLFWKNVLIGCSVKGLGTIWACFFWVGGVNHLSRM